MDFFDHLSYLEERDLIDDILFTMEDEYGQPVERIATLQKFDNSIKMTVIFEDYILLDALCTLTGSAEMVTVRIEGYYY